MSIIMVSTGLCYEVAETQNVLGQKVSGAGGNPFITLTINGTPTTFRSGNIIAAADSIEGLRPLYIQPRMPDTPPVNEAPTPSPPA